jgi:predicted NBD/HSP70 family sugar kinase
VQALVATDTTFMRDLNAAAILARLRVETPASVSTLASATGLSRQAVTRSLHVLEVAGVVEFSAPDRASSRSGRPAQLVRFRTEAGYVLGIYVTPQRIHLAVADLAGTIVGSHDVSLDGSSAIALLIPEVERVLDDSGVPSERVWFASVGAPGIIDPASGVIKFVPSMPELTGDVLVRSLHEHLSCPIYIDNDIKLATQGERWSDPGQVCDSLVFIHWGERVGAGIVIAGTLHRGASNDAGDIGFLDLFTDLTSENGDPNHYNPGGLGRFEEWIGALEIARLALAAARSQGDLPLIEAVRSARGDALEVIIDAAMAGNEAACQAIDEAARRFAVGVIAIRAILDPESIVVGGPMARLGDVLLESVRKHLATQPLNQPRLHMSSLGDDATVHGAIRHSLNEIERSRLPHGRPRQRSNA